MLGNFAGRPEAHEISTKVRHPVELVVETMEARLQKYLSPTIGFAAVVTIGETGSRVIP